MTKSGNWKERQQQILEALDLRAVYSELGVRFTTQEPNANGWLTCHAVGRDDDNPSAGVCIDPASPAFGKYHDFAGEGQSLSLFDFAAKYGSFSDWKAARTFYAQQAKISLPEKSPAPGRVRWDQIRVLEDAEAELAQWAETKPPITLEAILAAEAQVVSWPQAAQRPMTCIGFRSYRDLRATRTPCGMILYRADGQEFPAVPKGPGARKTHLLRGSEDGWIFVGGWEHIDEAGVIWKVEGLPDALALYPHLPPGHAVVTNTHGALAAASCAKPIFRGKTVFVIGDADQPGQAGARKFARAICRSAEVRLVPLPFEITENHGLDVRDYFLQGFSFADLLNAAETADLVTDDPTLAQGSDSRRVLYVSCNEHEVNRRAAEALSSHPGLYQRGGLLVRILQNDHLVAGLSQVRPYLAGVPSEIVRDHLSACVKFLAIKATRDGLEEVQVSPPQWCVNAVASFGDWPGMRHLEGVTDYPLFRKDGSILLKPGYDPPTRYVYFPTCELPPLPDRPTPAEASAARDQLLEVVCDFPFARPEHQAAWLAFLLTPLARAAFSGPSPLFLVDANTRGSGKSLLCDLVYLLLTGRPVPRMSPPPGTIRNS